MPEPTAPGCRQLQAQPGAAHSDASAHAAAACTGCATQAQVHQPCWQTGHTRSAHSCGAGCCSCSGQVLAGPPAMASPPEPLLMRTCALLARQAGAGMAVDTGHCKPCPAGCSAQSGQSAAARASTATWSAGQAAGQVWHLRQVFLPPAGQTSQWLCCAGRPAGSNAACGRPGQLQRLPAGRAAAGQHAGGGPCGRGEPGRRPGPLQQPRAAAQPCCW